MTLATRNSSFPWLEDVEGQEGMGGLLTKDGEGQRGLFTYVRGLKSGLFITQGLQRQ